MLIWIVVFALIAFRLAELFVVDDGPFEIFYHLRGWANKPPTGTRLRGTIAGLFACVHCMGLWLSLALGLFYYFFIGPNWIVALAVSLATAGLQSILANNFGRT